MLKRHKITSRKGDNVWEFSRNKQDATAHLYLHAMEMDWYLPYEGPSTIDKMFDQLVVDLAFQLEDWKVDNIPGYEFSQEAVDKNATRHPRR